METVKQIAAPLNREELVQLLWTTTSASEDDYLQDPPRDSRFEDNIETLAFNENLSESALDLGKKSKSSHFVTPRRLCKSADTLLTKCCKEQHLEQPHGCSGHLTTRESKGCLKYEKRFSSCVEFGKDRRGPCKSRRSVKPATPIEKKMLHVGDLNHMTVPLNYTLCLADYRTSWETTGNTKEGKAVFRLNIESLFKHLDGMLVGYGILRETETGSIVAEFTNLEDMDRVIRLPLSTIFGRKVKSWRIMNRCQYSAYEQSNQSIKPPPQQYHQRQYFSSSSLRRRFNNYNCHSYRQYLIAPDIPDTVPALEIQNALRFQGLRTGQVWRHMPRGFSIEVLRPCDYDRLCRDGVNFFNVAAFPVYAASTENPVNNANAGWDGKSQDYKNTAHLNTESQETVPDIPFAILQQTQYKENIQCFKCQRYGHKATHCKYWTRCVRCGGKHKVSDCDVPMTSASCCLCKGAHHAASHDCPVRIVHANAVQVTFAMTRTNLKAPNFGDCGTIS